MRGKQGFRQTRERGVQVVVAGFDATTTEPSINVTTPAGLNAANPSGIFSGFQDTALPQNPVTAGLPTLRLAHAGDKFALLSYSPDSVGNTPTTSQILISSDTKKWRARTLPTRNTTNVLKHAWAEVYGDQSQFIVSHQHYPDVAVSENGNDWTLLQNVFAVNGFQQNCITGVGTVLLAAADDAKVIYRSEDRGRTWTQVAANILITEASATVPTKALDTVLGLTYGANGPSNMFLMLAKRNDVSRYRYVLTSSDGATWTQRLRIDLGTTGTPQEPIIAASPVRTLVVFNNLSSATTLTTTATANVWTQVTSTPAVNWRALSYLYGRFVIVGEPFSTASAPLVATLDPAAASLAWSVKLTGTHKVRALAAGQTAPPQPDGSVTLLLRMNGAAQSTTFTDSSPYPKQITATNVSHSSAASKWPNTNSAIFTGPGQYLSIAGNADIAVGTGDFTIEAWVRLNAYTSGPFWDSRAVNSWNPSDAFAWAQNSDGSLRVWRSNFGNILITAPAAIPLNTWAHIVLVRQSGKTTIYVDGQNKGETTTAFNDANATTAGALIGRFGDGNSQGLNGYIGEFRVTKGVALYSGATFPVPTAPLLNYNPLGAPRALLTAAANQRVTLSWQPPNVVGPAPIINYIVQYSTDVGVTWVTAATPTTITSTITGLTNGTSYIFRVAAVTEEETGPYATAPAVVPTNGDPFFNSVSLLLRMNSATNTFEDTSPRPKTLTLTGDASFSSTVSKWGDGSGLFNAGYVTTNTSEDFSFGTGNFTIEFWAYPTTDTWAGAMFNIGLYYDGILFRQRSDWPYDALYLNGDYANWSPSQNMPSNTWTHVALVRESGNVSVYANGTRVLEWYNPTDLNATEPPYATIGAGAHSGLGEPFFGYLDELRVTKGVARYSGPTSAVPTGPLLGAPE